MIRIKVKSKLYPATEDALPRRVINDFRLALKDNEFVCLVGPSGCGKTTLLNLVAGLDDDFDGEIRFDEREENHKIGYVFQNPRLLPWRTVRENIELALNEPAPSGAIDNLLEVMQLADFQHVYPERLSLGMSRRVAIIRAFAINPDLLLMDEPFVSLDSATAQQVRDLLIGLWQQRPHTVLFVTHDLREAIALADRIVFLTSAPMQTLNEVVVPFSRNERQNQQLIEQFRHDLLQTDGKPVT
ncbi:MAG: ABC transporter ATP-binding protein [Gammaproteobacteria bacterium]|nr:ABC transporter ATP-binding protein [Gammaproteobacteria bacterium]